MTLNKLVPPYFLLFWVLQSCQVNNQVNPSVANCTNRSPTRLESKNVDNIMLSSTPINYDGMLNITESKGYKFIEQLPIQTAQIDKNSNTRSAKSDILTELGWVRLGSVNNTNGSATVGEKLIRTTHAVTIDPPEVPEKGDRVTIVNSVNLRADVPKPPTYRLTDQIAIIQPGEKVTISELSTFVDSTSYSKYTVVWAKISK